MFRIALWTMAALISGTAIVAAQVLTPSGVTVTPTSDTSLRVTWTDNSNNEDGFWVFRANNQAGSFVRVGTVPANTTVFNDTGLTAATTRHYRVVAFKNSQVTVVPEESSDVSVGASGTTFSPNQPPVAVDDTNSGTVPPTITLNGNVLTNDTDPNNDTLTVEQPNSNIAANGDYSIQFDTAGTFIYPYRVLDGRGGSDDGQLTITIDQANFQPVAVDDVASGETGQAISVNVLANDTDADGDILSVVQPNADIAADGTFNKTFATAGTYTYNYTVSDPNGGTDNGILTVTVNDPPPPPPSGEKIAFPGADGVGRFSKGGRGGTTMFVTNLNDSGAGSLRACVEASVPRTCVFRVSGYITVNTALRITNPFITIAGETAPGQGITLKNSTTNLEAPMRVITHDVIIRHLRFRPGNPAHNAAGSDNGDGIATAQIGNTPVYNVIIDHSSFSWATDENIDISPATETNGQPSQTEKVTVMNSLVYEGLRPHSKGPNLRSCGVSLIKNLIASNTIRNPNDTCGQLNAGGVRNGGGVSGEVEIRNNVIYNGVEGFLDLWDGRGENWTNVVGNVFIKGPSSLKKLSSVPWDVYPVDAWTFRDRLAPSGTCAQNGSPNCNPDADPIHIYVSDNIALSGAGKTWPTDGIGGVVNPNDAHLMSSTIVGDGQGEDGLTGPAMPSSEVLAHVLANAGAFPNNRDSADTKIVNDVTNRTGSIPQCTTSSTTPTCTMAPAYPTLASGSNYPDADNDGMDDTWEASNLGGTSANPNADADNDGWTNLEEFLHFMAAIR